ISMGVFQNLKLSMPFSLSAIAKNDLRFLPSTLAARIYLLLNFMAPELKTALMPNLSRRNGLDAGSRIKRHSSGVCRGVSIGFSNRLYTPLMDFFSTFLLCNNSL